MSKGYQLKITIKDSHPPIWRRVIVPAHITFYDLDNIIEALFGWTHSHLFAFDFYNGQVTFMGQQVDWDDDGNDATECIDEWMDEGLSFSYTYDFGDDWIHTVKVEKIVEYNARYPKVLKYKGPNMIEDCGGIWGFEQYRSEAEEFDMDGINAMFQTWNLEVAKPVAYRDEDLFLEDDEECDEEDMMAAMEDMFQTIEHMENNIRAMVKTPKKLTDVLSQFKKDELLMIAKAHDFSGYQKLKKKELVEWLSQHLLEEDYMQQILNFATKEDITLFERAIENKGICLTAEMIEHSLFMTSYGAFFADLDFYMVPEEVQEAYKKIMTSEFRKKRDDEWDFMTWCDAVIYLYGVISLEKFTEIYNVYEQQNLSVHDIENRIRQQLETEDCYVLVDGYFMDEILLEENIYQGMLEVQENLPYYMPKDKAEFWSYGEMNCQVPDETTAPFLNYLEEVGHMSAEETIMLYCSIQEEIRMGVELMQLQGLLSSAGIKLNTQKARKKATDMLRSFKENVRMQEYRGHTWNEVQNLNKKLENTMKREISSKIVQFPFGNKVYPNELCPCGSGKKYKHCCGRQN